MEVVSAIIEQLKDVNLFHNNTLIKIDNHIFNSAGEKIKSTIFNNIKDKYAVYSYGEYSLEYSKFNKPLYSSTDDAAQMFGSIVYCVKDNPKTNSLILNKGFVSTGRFVGELIGSAILIEKLCKTEMLSSKIGEIKYLPKTLCVIEHFVYLKSYSKKALENE